jgi:hypothetical protein
MVYRLFEPQDGFNWKKFEVQSCRSQQNLQVYLHPNSYKKLRFFEYVLDHRYSTRVPQMVGAAIKTVVRSYTISNGDIGTVSQNIEMDVCFL